MYADLDPNAEHPRHELRRQDIRRLAIGRNPALVQHDDTGRKRRRQVQIMEDGQHRQAAIGLQPPHGAQEGDLVGEVHVQGRLVEQQQLRLLRERHGHQHPLALASGELVRQPIREVQGVGIGEGALNRALVIGGRSEQATCVRRATHLHQLGGPEAVRQVELLGQDGDPARQRIPRPVPHRTPRHGDRAMLGCERAADETQQGRLAAAVGAQQGHHLAGLDGEVHAPQHRQRIPPGARIGEVDVMQPHNRRDGARHLHA